MIGPIWAVGAVGWALRRRAPAALFFAWMAAEAPIRRAAPALDCLWVALWGGGWALALALETRRPTMVASASAALGVAVVALEVGVPWGWVHGGAVVAAMGVAWVGRRDLPPAMVGVAVLFAICDACGIAAHCGGPGWAPVRALAIGAPAGAVVLVCRD